MVPKASEGVGAGRYRNGGITSAFGGNAAGETGIGAPSVGPSPCTLADAPPSALLAAFIVVSVFSAGAPGGPATGGPPPHGAQNVYFNANCTCRSGCGAGDHSEALVSVRRGLAGECRTGEDISVRIGPRRMVQHVEGLEAEFEQVSFLEGHAEFFVRGEVEGENAGPDQRIPADVSKCSGGRFHKSAGVVPAGRCRITQVSAAAGRNRTIVSDAGGGAIDASDGDHLEGRSGPSRPRQAASHRPRRPGMG